MKISIVTVVKDSVDCIKNTIESVLSQTYTDIEYVVLDGGSQDGTWDIVQEYAKKIDFSSRTDDDGVYVAMNMALEIVTGDWVAFMNAGDEYVDNSVIEKIANAADMQKDLVYGDVLVNDGENDKYISADLDGKIFLETPFCHQSLFVKTDLMKKRKFNTFYKILADYDFILDCYVSGRGFQYVPFPVSRYRLGGYSYKNRFLMYVEGVKIAMHYAAFCDIDYKKSSYYKGMQRELCAEASVTGVPLSTRRLFMSLRGFGEKARKILLS